MTRKTLARKLEKMTEKIAMKMVKRLKMILMIATLDPQVWDMRVGILVETWVDLQTFAALFSIFIGHFVPILPHPLLLLVLSLIIGFLFSFHFILLHLRLVLPLL